MKKLYKTIIACGVLFSLANCTISNAMPVGRGGDGGDNTSSSQCSCSDPIMLCNGSKVEQGKCSSCRAAIELAALQEQVKRQLQDDEHSN